MASQSVFPNTQKPDLEWLAKAAPETPLDPALPIIDPHMHLWDHKTGYRYFVEEFAEDVAASGHDVQATVFVECSSMYRAKGPEHLRSVGETEFAVGMAAIAASGKYTSCEIAKAIVGFVDLTLGERAEEALAAQLEAGNGRLRGIRQRAKWDADPAVRGLVSVETPGLYLTDAFNEGMKRLRRFGLSFDASIYHPQLPEVTTLARQHSDVEIVLIHTGSPVGHSSYAGREKENHARWLADMTELASCENVSVKLGGFLMTLGNFDFSKAEIPPTSSELADLWRPYIEPCIELFGANRCMASSNFPVEKAGCGYGTIWNMFKRLTTGCSADERALIFKGTAERAYRINS